MPEDERRNLADRIARDIMLDNPSLAPGGSGSSHQKEVSALVITPTNSRFGSKPVYKSNPGRGQKRKHGEDSKEEAAVDKGSRRERPLSKRLPRTEWPSGYTSDDVDSFTVTDLLLLKQAQDKAERRSKEGLPGVVNR